MTTEQKLREALENLANVFHEGRAVPLNGNSAGYVDSVVQAADDALMETALFVDSPAPEKQAPQMADPIPSNISADLERSDWTPEEALRWYAAGKHYDTVGGRARILDNGAVASNALKSLSLEYAKHKGDVALLEATTPPQAEQAEAAKIEVPKDWCIRMAMLEVETGADMEAGVQAPEAAEPETERAEFVNHLLSLLDDQTLGLEEDQEDIIKEAAALLSADSKAGGEPSGAYLSWNGFNLRGDVKSIEEAKRLLHEAGLVPQLRAIIASERAARPQQQAKPLTNEPIMTLSGHQLLEALDFIAPDRDAEQLEQKVCIQRGPARQHEEGSDPAGLYCWAVDTPEEGAISLEPPSAPAVEEGA